MLAKNAALMKSKFFPGAQLALAGVAGETGQVVDAVPGPPHPIRGTDASAALGTPRSKVPVGQSNKPRDGGLSEAKGLVRRKD